MGKSEARDLLSFIKPFGKEIVDKVLWLRGFIWDRYPQTNELIYDNYNAVAVGWSPTDRVGHTFCSIAIGRSTHNIHFGFYWGNEIADPKKILLGEGNQYRYLLVKDLKDFPKKYVEQLMEDAYENSMKKIGDPSILLHGLTITKSVSEKKRGSASKSVKPRTKSKKTIKPKKTAVKKVKKKAVRKKK